MSTTDTFTHYHFVPDRMLDENLGVDPASVRWHVVEQRWSGVGAGARRLDDDVTSFATIQEALALYGTDTKNPVIPCGLFAECEHCAKAMADEAPMAHETPCTVCEEAATDAIDGICADCLHAAHDALEDIAAADNADQWEAFWRKMLREYHALAAAVALVAALLVPLHASAADVLVAPHPTNGSTYVWPAIAGEADCSVTRFWEDGSAVAYCAGHGATWHFDPDGRFIPDPYTGAYQVIETAGWHVAK